MLIPTVVMAVLATVFVFLAYQKGGEAHIQGLKAAGGMLTQVLPLLVFAFIIAGIIPLLVPQEAISRWIGTESGLKGIIFGTVAGGFLPGGPYVVFPLLAGFLRVGASLGTMVALVTGWSLLAFSRMPIEIGVLGWKFWLIRLACTFFFAPIAGLIASKLFARVSLI
ncbi:MAG: permease [Candidatus Hodarchaeota archaeon]